MAGPNVSRFARVPNARPLIESENIMNAHAAACVCASCLFNISPERLTKGECKWHISIPLVALLRAIPIISAITRRASRKDRYYVDGITRLFEDGRKHHAPPVSGLES